VASVDLHLNSVLKRCRDVRFRRVEAEAVVLRQNVSEVMVLNEVGARILDLADGVMPIAGWVDALFEEFEVEREILEEDVLGFASELTDAGVLELAWGDGEGGDGEAGKESEDEDGL
jgi:hypothetical protein